MAFHMERPVPDPTTNEDEGIYKVAELMDTLDQVERYNALARSLKMSTLITTTSDQRWASHLMVLMSDVISYPNEHDRGPSSR